MRGSALKSVSEREKADADSIKNLNALEKALSALLNEENARTYAEDTARQALQDYVWLRQSGVPRLQRSDSNSEGYECNPTSQPQEGQWDQFSQPHDFSGM